MDFGIGFLSNNLMLPILDFFYGIVPSYGLAIVALTLVIRFALYPLSAGSIRNMRRTRIAQPMMQKRVKEVQERYKDNPTKLQEEMSKVYQEFGNPLAGCFPILLQMPILFALFATLRGSPFSDVNYSVNVQILPQEQIEQIQPKAFTTSPHNIYVADGVHEQVLALLPGGNQLAVGESVQIALQTPEGKPMAELLAAYDQSDIQPSWQVTKGQERVRVDEAGNLVALQPGEATLQVTVPGLASNRGFLFIKALGRVGATDENGNIHWDIVGMVLFFGISLYVNQLLSGQGQGTSMNPQQETVNKITPILFSGMFLFFPLPAGVLMYMVIANIFQTAQTFILSREPLPENLQKLVAEQEKGASPPESVPFEHGKSKPQTVDVKAREVKAAKKKAQDSKGKGDRQVRSLPFETGQSKKKKA